MADKKITELTNITGANLVDADEFVVVDISADETKAITLGELKEAFDSGSGFVRITGDTMTGDLGLSGADVTFGDNDKAIFGAGSDLQIYHDGSHSYVSDQGTGNIKILADDFVLKNSADTETMIQAFTDASVSLWYDNAAKLTTTATGVDVTGTANADAFSLNAGSQVSSVGTFYLDIDSDNNSTGAALNITSDNKAKFLARFQEGGDISFYEDTGTTPKFFWDASAETLRLGEYNSSGTPSGSLFVDSNANNHAIHIEETGGGSESWQIGVDTDGDLGFYNSQSTTASVTFDDSGNVGIGTSSPSANLEITQSGNNVGLLVAGGGYNYTAKFESSDAEANIIIEDSNSTNNGNMIGVATNDMYFITNTSERMRIDSSGSVGIGTSSPSSYWANADDLVVATSGNTGISVVSGTTSLGYLIFADSTAGGDNTRGGLGYDHSTNDMLFRVNNDTKMTIDSSGNVGIGTSSPSAVLDIQSTSATQLELKRSGNAGQIAAMIFKDGADAQNRISSGSSNLVFGYGASNTEAMRIDSSGNLLVGKTANNLTDDGIVLRGTGELFVTRANDVAAFNRRSSDGNIVTFRKDGTTVGSIGTNTGQLYIGYDNGSQDVGILFGNTTANSRAIIPCRFDGSIPDGAINIGDDSGRWKDLYLSGGVYLGGTGSANKLDDYESGTYTATLTPATSGTITLSSSYNLLSYTKVGRLVTVSGRVRVSSVSSPLGQMVNVSLPFVVCTSGQESERSVPLVLVQNAAQDASNYLGHPTADGTAFTQFGRSNSYGTHAAPDFSGDELVSINHTYFTN